MAREDSFHIGVKILISDHEHNILLLRANVDHASNDYWDIPGGRIQIGETAEDTLRREAAEETGLDLSDRVVEFAGAHLTPTRIPVGDHTVGLVFLVYRCQWDSRPPITLSGEHSAYRWASRADAAQVLGAFLPRRIFEDMNPSP